MRPFVPTVYLLIGTIIVSLEIESTLSDATQPVDEKNDASTDNDRDGEISTNVLEMWGEKEPDLVWKVYDGEEIDRNTDATGGRRKAMYLDATEHPEYHRRMDLDENAAAISNRGEMIKSWLDLSAESKRKKKKRKTKMRTRTKAKTTTETATMNPWFYRWKNKRKEIMYGTSSNIRRPILVPFNSWGGKRGKEYWRSDVTIFPVKRTKLSMYDRYNRDAAANGYEIKREIADFQKVKWKTPFNSWGGKRAEKSEKSEKSKDDSDNESMPGVFKEYGFKKERNNGNNNDNFFYRIDPIRLFNETDEDNSPKSSTVNQRLSLIPNKRVEYHDHKICKKTRFDPWHGKRSFEPHTIRFGKNVALLTLSSMGNKIFLCCYPID